MRSISMEDQPRPATGYPAPGHPPAQPSTNPNGPRHGEGHPTAYPSYSTAGTAYPYTAPPPQPAFYNPNPYYDPGQPYLYPPRTTFLRRFFAILIALFVITGVIMLITWLVLRPRMPQFRVDSLSVSNFNVSPPSSSVSGNWDVLFTVRNPNRKIKIYYERVVVSAFYKTAFLSETTVPPFYQATRDQRAMRATLAALSVYVDGWALNKMNQERTRGSVSFNVRLSANVRFKARGWPARRRLLIGYCPDLTVGMTSNGGIGTLIGGPRACSVAL